MPVFEVRVVIENRPGVGDPEGSTILEDLVMNGGAGRGWEASSVEWVRTAKMLKLGVRAASASSAEEAARRMCDDLRVYNPAVSRISVAAAGPGGPQ